MTASSAHVSGSVPARLLFIDDEQRVLSSMKAMFRRNYQVFVADSGEKALEFLASERVDVVISDQRMPNMTGVEVLARIKQEYPEIIRILLTGYADLEAVEASINDCEVFRYLMKPCPPDELKSVINLALEQDRSTIVREAQLIQFPSGNRGQRTSTSTSTSTSRTVNTTSSSADRSDHSNTSPARSSARGRAEILVLSPDRELVNAIKAATDGATVRQVNSLEGAMTLLRQRDVSVIVTDTAADRLDIEQVTRQIRDIAPIAVPIVASQRSDATSLINLINTGDIYRFLLKPVSKGQCRLWLESAIRRHNELATSLELKTRHKGDRTASSSGLIDWMLKILRGRFGSQS